MKDLVAKINAELDIARKSGETLRAFAWGGQGASPIQLEGGEGVKRDSFGRLLIESLVSTPRVDHHGEIVRPYAFLGSVEEFEKHPVMLAYHQWSRPVGLWNRGIDIDPDPASGSITMRGFVSSADEQVQQLVIDGIMKSSISFWPDKIGYDEEQDALTYELLTMVETSLVPIPANDDTSVRVLPTALEWMDAKVRELTGNPTISIPSSLGEPTDTEEPEAKAEEEPAIVEPEQEREKGPQLPLAEIAKGLAAVTEELAASMSER